MDITDIQCTKADRMSTACFRTASAFVLLLASGLAWGQPAEKRREYEPTWESLDCHQTPQWFMDAKVGLFIYPLHPTKEQYEDYKQKFGGLGTYNSHDGWDKTPWDPEGTAQLAADAGARYVVFGVDPYSFWLTYPSKYAGIEGSPFVPLRGKGSKKDCIGEMARAVRGKGLRFGIYRNYLHPGKYPYFLETTYELIDRYRPASLWLDGDKMAYPSDVLRSKELAAYYYNNSEKQNEVALEDALGSYKRKT